MACFCSAQKMEKTRRQALTRAGNNNKSDGVTNPSSPSSCSNVEAVEAVGGMFRGPAAAASAGSSSINTSATTTATDAGAKLVKRGAAGGSGSWVGNALR